MIDFLTSMSFTSIDSSSGKAVRRADHSDSQGRDNEPSLRIRISCGSHTQRFGTTQPSEVEIAGDLRIDNGDDLLRRLHGQQFTRSNRESCAHIVAEAYRRWGTDSFAMLDGEFAFVLWDQANQRLYAVRDALGMRALFYYRDSAQLLVASTIGQLLENIPSSCRSMSDHTIANYLANRRPSAETTFYAQVFRVPAGHWLEARDNGAVRLERYWDPLQVPLIRHKNAEDYALDFRQRFLQSVRQLLPSHGRRIALHVSGGFDSSAIVAATQHWNSQCNLHLQMWAFTNVAADANANESLYVDELLTRYPMTRSMTRSEDFWAFRSAHTADHKRDEPYLPPYFSRFIDELETARTEGIGIILSGTGGDEIGGSSMYLVDLILHGHWGNIWSDLKQRAESKHISSASLLKAIIRATASWLLPFQSVKSQRAPIWLHPDLVNRLRRQTSTSCPYPWIRGPSREHLFRTLEYMWTEPLFSHSKQVASQYGVELLHPFLNRRLFEWALSVPPFRMGESGRVKAPLRHALVDLLPQSIVNRNDKGRYGYYFDLGLREKERDRIRDYLDKPISADLGYVLREPLRTAYDNYCQGESIHRGYLWRWVTLEQWLRTSK